MNERQKTILGEGRYLRLIDDKGWEYVERKRGRGVVAITAVTDEQKILLVEQFRPALGGPVLELPAGLVGDDKGWEKESFTDAARRELLEETGYAALEMEFQTEGPSSTGLSNEIVSYLRAGRLSRQGAGGGVADERIKVHEVPLATVKAWLTEKRREGLWIDPRIYIGLYFL